MPFSRTKSVVGSHYPHTIEVQDSSCYALVIDIRSREEFDDDHIPGVVHGEPITLTRSMPRKWLGIRSVGIV